MNVHTRIHVYAGIFLEKNFREGKSMFQENEGGLEVGARIHNTNVHTLRAIQLKNDSPQTA